MSVNANGSFLSALLFEQSCSHGDQEGLLLGKVVSRRTNTITDLDISCTKEDVITYVQSHIPCTGLFSWYDDSGCIVQERLLKLLRGHSHKDIVGWYKWRRRSSGNVSLRERAIHRHLLEALPGVKPASFLFCLCVSGPSSAASATHTFSHTFFGVNGRTFRGLPLTIVNLGDTVSSNYKTTPAQLATTSGSVYEKTMKRFHDHFVDGATRMRNASGVRAMNAHLLSQLDDLCVNVNASELRVAELTCQVAALQKRARRSQSSSSSSRRQSESGHTYTPVSQFPVLPAVATTTAADVKPLEASAITGSDHTPESGASPIFSSKDLLRYSLEHDNVEAPSKSEKSPALRSDSVAARLFLSGNEDGTRFLAVSSSNDVESSGASEIRPTAKEQISAEVTPMDVEPEKQPKKGGDAFSFVDEILEKAGSGGGQTANRDRLRAKTRSSMKQTTAATVHANHDTRSSIAVTRGQKGRGNMG